SGGGGTPHKMTRIAHDYVLKSRECPVCQGRGSRTPEVKLNFRRRSTTPFLGNCSPNCDRGGYDRLSAPRLAGSADAAAKGGRGFLQLALEDDPQPRCRGKSRRRR